jgi:hypothetical protein
MERSGSGGSIVEFNRPDSSYLGKSKCWTFLINKGCPFEIRIKNNPSCVHDGAMTIWKFVGYDSEVSDIQKTIKNFGQGVDVQVFCETQSEQQSKERQDLLGVQREGYVFQCEQCPGCFFFDPLVDGDCGVSGWEPESFEASLKVHTKAQSDYKSCPVYSEVRI